MKHTLLYLLLLMLSSMLYTSCAPCTKKAECPAFQGTQMFGWFPYKQGDSYYFKTNNGATDTLSIREVKQTQAYQFTYKTGMNYKEKYCEVEGSIAGYKKDTTRPRWLGIYVHEVEEGEMYQKSFSMSFRFTSVIGLATDSTNKLTAKGGGYYGKEVSEMQINGNVYKNVLDIYATDTVNAAKYRMDRMIIVKTIGIIGYRSYPDSVEYWLQ